jgi:hypothetical protein
MNPLEDRLHEYLAQFDDETHNGVQFAPRCLA